jgi:hypothetical protein
MMLATTPGLEEVETDLDRWRRRAEKNATAYYALWSRVTEWCDARKDDPDAQALRDVISFSAVAP